MKQIVTHETIGEIVYEEGFWLGRKSVSVNGNKLETISKNTFKLPDGGTLSVKGNFLRGAELVTNSGEHVRLTPPVTWYEITLAVIAAVLSIVWGNVVELVRIVPLVGGALGGFFSALIAILGLYVMRKVDKWYFKTLIGIAFIGLAFLVCYLLGLMILAIA